MTDKKRVSVAFGKRVYYLGTDKNGKMYWLEAATYDCGWYWGFGYVRTYTNNSNPNKARDIRSHQHFDSLFFGQRTCCADAFKEFFPVHPFSDNEVWKICELMKSFYVARAYADMLYSGGAHITQNPAKSVIRNEDERDRINREVIPAITKEVYAILYPSEVQA